MTGGTYALGPAYGIATVHQLRARGHSKRSLRLAVEMAELIRVKRGWYADPGASPEIVQAVRVGGRLACISAAAWFGWAIPEDRRIHVAVPSNAGRLRDVSDRRCHPPAQDRDDAVLHWDDDQPVVPRGGSIAPLLVVSRESAVRQIVTCQHPDVAGAILDSVLHREPHRGRALRAWLDELPHARRRRLPRLESGCESFLESIGRIRLERAGIAGRHQVDIPGVGRVDELIEGWLVVEWDGRAFHDTPDAHEQDRWRDAQLAIRGYRSLRFTYRMVMDDWYAVIGAVRAALAQGRPRPR
ncbi:DUF559 domain-containing protein [Plantibacter flavus]|uniref:DUF559 domain-containing protein n=1 Tax=Plantibacter TaxID=190323 RepID=UPI002379DD46|nr:DUF559 domain-containing protein [Plantibacter flavus]MDD9153789.1 DUF559 domain-containing protein [Plantibacter flavus]